MEQVTTQQCPLNVIYFRVLLVHCSIYSVGTGKNLFYFPYFVPSQFQELILLPAKKLASVLCHPQKEKYDYIRLNLYLSLRLPFFFSLSPSPFLLLRFSFSLSPAPFLFLLVHLSFSASFPPCLSTIMPLPVKVSLAPLSLLLKSVWLL